MFRCLPGGRNGLWSKDGLRYAPPGGSGPRLPRGVGAGTIMG